MSTLATSKEECLESGRILEAQRKLEDALVWYERAAEMDKTSWVPCAQVLRTLYQLNRLDEMDQRLNDFLDSGESAAAMNDLGVIKAERDEPLEAAKQFIQAQRSKITLPGSLILGNLAYVLCLADRREDCAKVCDKALRLDQSDARSHYVLSVLEAKNYESRMRPVSRVAQNGNTVEVFRLLRFEGQGPEKFDARITGGDSSQIRLNEPVSLARRGTHWGVLAKYAGEVWCGFSRQDSDDLAAVTMPMPTDFSLVQRRRWVRVVSTGGVSGLAVRAFPPGTEPFPLQEVTELNLSGGGAAIRTKPELPRGTKVTLFLNLENEEIKVDAQVTRISNPQTSKPYSALTFVDLDEDIRERIARFVHLIQLDRKRGQSRNQD